MIKFSTSATIDSYESTGQELRVQTGDWDTAPQDLPKPHRGITSLLQNAGAALFLGVASSIKEIDPWLDDWHRHSSSALVSTIQRSYRRRITAMQAREIALEILYQAERERLQLAEAEAFRTLYFEELL